MTDPVKTSWRSPLVDHLLNLDRRDDRGAFAALRTGLGKPPGAAPLMLPIVAPYLRENDGPRVRAAFITASLFATHRHHAEMGNLGASLRSSTRKHSAESVEARFVHALDAEPEDMHHHLRGLVSLCESAGAPIDWHKFHSDCVALLGDDDEDRRTKARTAWARGFWQPAEDTHDTETTEEANAQ